MNFHGTIDVVTAVLLPLAAFFLSRVITHQDTLEKRVNHLSQRMAALDGEVENV